MSYVVEIWSDVGICYFPLAYIYKSEVKAIGKMNKYVAEASENGWNTHGRVINATIRDKALVPA